MATTPYFILSPNTLLSIVGLVRGPDKTVPTPAEDWRKARVAVIIPALNEAVTITFCLQGLARQTMKPSLIMLIDDGSKDRTVEYARDFCKLNGMEIVIIQRKAPIGKTPTLKRQARELDVDVEFILDSDTVLDSPNYIERTVEELYQAVGIASACGTVQSLRRKDRTRIIGEAEMTKFTELHPEARLYPQTNTFVRFQMAVTSLYRDSLYTFLQKFVYRGQMSFFGSILHPVGCAVAYRRKYIENLFNTYEPILGDDLTNSEDIFIGLALTNHGYRNIQLNDVHCSSQEPALKRLPHQFYMWSSAFLQSCYYFNDLTMSPFKAFRRWRHQRAFKKSPEGKALIEKRKIQEPYREAFGIEVTKKYGRPIGWMIFMSLLEKISFPCAIVAMLVLRMWEALAVTIVAETILSLVIVMIVAPHGKKLVSLFKGILVTPIRYSALLFDLTTTIRFAGDLWISKNRKWRK